MRLEQVQKQTQKLIMSPQMQQGIHILQLPLMELSSLIEQELINNPVLEEVQSQEAPGEKNEAETENTESDFEEEFDRLAEMDDEWKEYYKQTASYNRSSDDQEKKRRHYEDSITSQESLQDHLLNQWNLSGIQVVEHAVGELLIGNINENGYLAVSLQELSESSGYSTDVLERGLRIIQGFDPIGVGARNIQECLFLQLSRLDKGEGLEARIVQAHLDELGRKNYPAIAKALNQDVQEIQKAAELIATLDPKPGRLFEAERTQYAIPDVIVEKINDRFVVTLNNEKIPHLKISNLYRGLIKDKSTETQTKDYIRQKVQSGQWLIKNILLRQQTLLNIAQTLVSEQQDFFEYGPGHLKPLTMQTVASKIGVHESTVSRAIAGKYMMTPRGLFQMKFFFTPGLQTQTGEITSTTNIKQMISDLVSKENPQQPLSDQELMEMLKTKGIEVARRTIAKYRQELKILPSNMRRKY